MHTGFAGGAGGVAMGSDGALCSTYHQAPALASNSTATSAVIRCRARRGVEAGWAGAVAFRSFLWAGFCMRTSVVRAAMYHGGSSFSDCPGDVKPPFRGTFPGSSGFIPEH